MQKNEVFSDYHKILPLKEINILLCVSASISAYKALELVSGLKKLGANIAVVLSEEAKKFVSPLSFEALSHTKTLHKDSESWVENDTDCSEVDLKKTDFGEMDFGKAKSSKVDFGDIDSMQNKPKSTNHIAYAKWAHIAIIAPATANTIAKLANGIADNLITQTLLATNNNRTQILLAPAMNTQMFFSPQVQNALKTLGDFGYEIIPPKKALLACNTYGVGALAQVEEIIFRTLRAKFARDFRSDLEQKSRQDFATKSSPKDSSDFWENREIIITGGGASAQIDSVRAISNHSSGKQAIALAKVAYTLGAKVTLISSKIDGFLPSEIKCVNAQTNKDYKNALESCLQQTKSQKIDSSKSSQKNKRDTSDTKNECKKPVLFMAAALCDYTLKSPKNYKIKKSTSPNLTLELIATDDILSSISSEQIHKIGFKAESIEKNGLQEALENAKKMLQSANKNGKDCACVCLNVLENNAKNGVDFSPFGADTNSFYLLDSRALADEKNIIFLSQKSKLALSYQIFDFVRASLADLANAKSKAQNPK